MRKNGIADVLRILTYVIICFLLAAAISPLLYKVGKNFAEVFANKDTTDSLVWLGKKAEKAEFDTYFKRSLLLASLLGLWPLIHSIKTHRQPGQAPIWASLFGKPVSTNSESWLSGPRQCGNGLFISIGVFLIMTLLIQIFGWRVWDHTVPLKTIPTLALESLQPALFVSLFEEILFRGFLMAIFLRAFRPSLAIITLSILFASVHFLQPLRHTTVSDPYALTAGFEMLSLIGKQFLELHLIIFSFSTLCVTGIILATARYRTGALWLPVGIHAGWIFSLKLYLKLTEHHPEHLNGAGIFFGPSVLEGILPLGALIMTGILIAIYLRKLSPKETHSP